jgi:hypothetical protein
MGAAVNASDPLQTSPPMDMMDSPLSGILNLAIPQLFAGGSNGYASLMLIFGSIAVLKTYTYQVKTWFNEHFSQCLRPFVLFFV